jgi:hypothetical protein
LDGFGVADTIAQAAGLAAVIAVPALVLDLR